MSVSTKAKHMHGAYADTDALAGLVFCLSGKFSESHAALASFIKRNAGEVKPSVSKAVTHLVSTVDDFAAHSSKVQRALSLAIPIVTERWVRESIEANEALPLRPEFVLNPGNRPLARPEQEALDAGLGAPEKPKPREARAEHGGEMAKEPAEPVTFTNLGVPLMAPLSSVRIDESGTPSALLTAAKDASLPLAPPGIGDLPAPKPVVNQEGLAPVPEDRGEAKREASPPPKREEEPPLKRQKVEAETPSGQGEVASLAKAPATSDQAVLPPSQSLAIPAPPPAMEVTPSGAETGGPSSMQVTQRAYHIKVLQRREYSTSSMGEITGLLERQLLEGINAHNVERDPTAAGFGSVADVMERGDGVDGGAVLVENLRDYENQDYYTLITYALRGKEFGSLHRNDETGKLNPMLKEDQELMDRVSHVHQPLIPINSAI